MRKWRTVRASLLIVPALLLSGSYASAVTQPSTATPAQEPAIDPAAKDVLTRMSDYFKSLPTFSVHESITRDQVINGDLKVQKNSTADILVRRPNGLKADIMADDDKSHSIYFDGKTLTLSLLGPKYYAQMDAPGTLGDAIDKAEASYGVEFPATDFMRMIGGADMAANLTAAGYVGKSRVGDVETEHYAYRTPEVDYQLWVEPGDKPLPRKLVITSKKLPAQPQYSSVITWNLSPNIGDSSFAFTPPEGATKIPFGPPPPGATKKPAQQRQTQPPKE